MPKERLSVQGKQKGREENGEKFMPNGLMGLKEKWKGMLAFGLGMGVLLWLDQWTKQLAVRHLMGKPAIVLMEGVLELRYLENRGAAFGMFQGRQFFFFLVALAVFAMIVFGLYRMPFTRRYLPLGCCMALLSAGAAGNMIDRISQQYVVDFIYFRLIDFPIFNVADCYVTVAAFCMMILVLWVYHDEDWDVFLWKRKMEA